MTVSSELSAVARDWTGVETVFSTGFKAADPAYVRVSTASEVLVRGYHYTSSLDVSGLLVVTPLGSMPPAPQTLTIERDTTIVQDVALQNGADFDAPAIEKTLDRVVMVTQENKRRSISAETNSLIARDNAETALDTVNDLVEGVIPVGSITNARMADMPAATFKVRLDGAGDGPPVDATATQARQLAGMNPAFLAAPNGSDNGVFDNAAAFNAAKVTAGAGGRLSIGKRYTGVYKFASGVDLSGVLLDVEPGVRLEGPFPNDVGLEVSRPTWLRYNYGSTIFDYRAVERPSRQDPVPMRLGGPPTPEPVFRQTHGVGSLVMEKIAWNAGDTWSADAIGAVSTATAEWAGLTNDSALHAALVDVAGDHGPNGLRWFWDGITGSNVYIGCVAKCSGGWVAALCLGDDNSILVFTHVWGGSTTAITIPEWFGRDSHESLLPRQCVWEMRPVTPFSFSLILNGLEVKRISTATVGWIWQHGPCVYTPNAGPFTVRARELASEQAQVSTAKPLIGLLVVGDSNSDDTRETGNEVRFPNVWTHWTEALLDGTRGMRLLKKFNIARAGNTVAQQATALAAFLATADADYVTHAIVALAINDIQAGAIFTDVYPVLRPMVESLQSRGIAPVLMVPHEFYSRGLAESYSGVANYGQPTSNYQTGASVRATVFRLACDLGCEVVDAQRAIGHEVAHWLRGDFTSYPRLTDGIHFNPLGAQQIGEAGFLAIARQVEQRYLPHQRGLPVNANTMLGAGFTTDGTLQISISNFSDVAIHGKISNAAGFAAGNTMLLPPFLRPVVDKRITMADAAGVKVEVTIQANGLVVTQTASAATDLLFNLHYQARR